MAAINLEMSRACVWNVVASKFLRLHPGLFLDPIKRSYCRRCPMMGDFQKCTQFTMSAMKPEILIMWVWNEVASKFQLILHCRSARRSVGSRTFSSRAKNRPTPYFCQFRSMLLDLQNSHLNGVTTKTCNWPWLFSWNTGTAYFRIPVMAVSSCGSQGAQIRA